MPPATPRHLQLIAVFTDDGGFGGRALEGGTRREQEFLIWRVPESVIPTAP